MDIYKSIVPIEILKRDLNYFPQEYREKLEQNSKLLNVSII